jgi:hypothetical protein
MYFFTCFFPPLPDELKHVEAIKLQILGAGHPPPRKRILLLGTIHPSQLNNNRHPVDGALVGAGSRVHTCHFNRFSRISSIQVSTARDPSIISYLLTTVHMSYLCSFISYLLNAPPRRAHSLVHFSSDLLLFFGCIFAHNWEQNFMHREMVFISQILTHFKLIGNPILDVTHFLGDFHFVSQFSFGVLEALWYVSLKKGLNELMCPDKSIRHLHI